MDEGASGAAQVDFLTQVVIHLSLAQWEPMREGMVCMDAPTWGELDQEIGKLCTKVKCDYQTKQAVKSLQQFLLALKNIRKSDLNLD